MPSNKLHNNRIDNQNKYIFNYYILFFGSSGTGTKTSLIKRIKEGKFIDITGENKEIYEKIIYEKNDKKFVLYLTDADAAKKEKSQPGINIEKELIIGISNNINLSNCIIMGYDVTNKKSFEEIKECYSNKIKYSNHSILKYLLGNKIDLKDNIEVIENEAKEFAGENNLNYFSLSVKNDINIQNFIDNLKINIEKIDYYKNNEIFDGNPLKAIYKVIFIGDCGIGAKTGLINRLLYNTFSPDIPGTIGCSYDAKLFKFKNGKDIIIEFWDTPGQEIFRNITKLFLKDFDCAILGYDITSKESFENVKNFWYQYSLDYANTKLTYLVGNKIDLLEQEAVNEKEAKKYSNEKNMRFFQISCINFSGIKEFKNDLINEIIKI